MIELTDLNKVPFLLNPFHIETIRKIPETKITLTNGNYYLVSEGQDEVVSKIIAYNRRVLSQLTAK